LGPCAEAAELATANARRKRLNVLMLGGRQIVRRATA
jgi:hypothetical protein